MSGPTSSSLYQPLNPERHELRLLRILEQAETIACTLEIASLDGKPTYSALSYEWARYQGENPGEDVPPIMVNSLPVSTTTNLSLALKYLDKNHGPYWIDALCINQEDDNERGHQVRMMTKIYQGAARVYAWLGLNDEGSTLGMRLISDFMNDFMEFNPPDVNEWGSEWVRQKLADPQMDPRWKGLGKILGNSYWTRLWIAQELVVPKAVWIILKYGSHEIVFASLHLVLNIVEELRDIEFGGIFGVQSPRIQRIFSEVLNTKASKILEDAKSWRKKDIERLGLLSLLRRHIASSCSNPRDRAYALLGFELGREGYDLEINYSAPLHKVFLDVAQYVIQRAQRLDILGVYKGSRHVLPLPSWVPDWQLDYELFGLGHRGYPWMACDYDASLDSVTSVSFSDEGTVLTARCILLGSITICTLPNTISVGSGDTQNIIALEVPPIFECHSRISAWLGFCVASLYGNGVESPNEDYPFDPATLESIFTAFYETVVLGYAGQVFADAWPLPEVAKYCNLVGFMLKNEAVNSLDEELPWTGDQLQALNFATSNHLQLFSIELQEPKNPTQTSEQYIASRTPRKSIGRGELRFAKDGDIVAIVHGCKLPILLRKEDKGYSVLSGLYVHGFMHGEAIGQFPEVDIDLI